MDLGAGRGGVERMAVSRGGAVRALLAAFFLSGFSALVYEVTWVRWLTLLWGSAAHAVVAILSLFMGGLAVGGWWGGRLADRVTRPLRFLAALEAGTAVWGAASAWGWPHLVGADWAVQRWWVAAAGILPPTILMGATLPAAVGWIRGEDEGLGAPAGRLYFVNTLGAAAGAAVAGAALVAVVGLKASVLLAAAGNLVAATVAALVDRRAGLPARREATHGENFQLSSLTPAVVFVTGMAGMGLEFAWTRTVSLVLGSSAYAFASILSVFLLGLALGGHWGGRLSRGGSSREALGLVCAGVGVWVLAVSPWLDRLPYEFLALLPLRPGFAGVSLVGLLLAAQVLLVPAVLMGMAFPLAVAWANGAERGGEGTLVGRVYAANTIGGVVGPPLAAFALVPLAGFERVLLLCGAAYAVVGIACAGSRRPVVTLATLLAAGVAWGLPGWERKALSSGPYVYAHQYLANRRAVESGEIVYYREGPTATVAVRRQGDLLSLRINGKTDASTGTDLETQLLFGHLPALLHSARAPSEVGGQEVAPTRRGNDGGVGRSGARVLMVGLGSGITLGALTRYPVGSVVAAEISPEVVGAARMFDAHQYRALEDPRVRVVVGDGRRALLTDTEGFDLISSAPTNPWVSGAGNLFTREYYQLCRSRLRPGGVVCQFLQLYSLAPEDVRLAVRTFAAVFPEVQLWAPQFSPDLMLVGSAAPLRLDLGRLAAMVARPAVRADLGRMSVEDPARFLSFFVADREGAIRLAGGGPVNTDDRPTLAFSAARALLSETVAENLAALEAVRQSPLSILSGAVSPAERARLARAANLRRGVAEGNLLRARRDLDGAVLAYRKGLLADPAYQAAGWHLANLLWERARLALARGGGEAAGDLEEAVRLNPAHYLALTELGRLYARQGRIPQARDALRRALAVEPAHLPARQLLSTLP